MTTFARLLASFAISAACWAQSSIPLILPEGAPLQVTLEEKTPIRQGQPIRATLDHPVYVFDREVLPAGLEVRGYVASVEGPSGMEKVQVYMRGRTRLWKRALAAFDAIILPDGRELPLRTNVSQGRPMLIRLDTGVKQPQGTVGKAKARVRTAVANNNLAQAFAAASKDEKVQARKKVRSGAWRGVRTSVLAYWPFGEQNMRPGASFTATLEAPLDFGEAAPSVAALESLGSAPPESAVVEARLLHSLSSGSAQPGETVRAVVTRPLLDEQGGLILPEGSLLLGETTLVQPAKRFARNGKLRFRFNRIELPSGVTRYVDGMLEAAELNAMSGIDLDEEGGANKAASKKRLLMPALTVALLWTGPSGQDNAKAQGVGVGWSGFGLLGTAATLSSRAAAAPLGIWGAANSVYFNLIKHADEIEFPKNTRLEIRFGRPRPAEPTPLELEAAPEAPAGDSRPALKQRK